MPQGMKSKDMQLFKELLIKANEQQILFMKRELDMEFVRRNKRKA